MRPGAGEDLTESRASQVRFSEVGTGEIAACQGDSPQRGAAEVDPSKIAQLEMATVQGGVTQIGPAKRAPGKPQLLQAHRREIFTIEGLPLECRVPAA